MPRKENPRKTSGSADGAAPAKRPHARAKRAAAATAAAGGQLAWNPQAEYDAIARLAHSYWEARGRQGGSPEEDWFRAEQEIRRQRAAGSE